MRVGYLGPPGTFSHDALLALPAAAGSEAVPLPTVHDTVLAVHAGAVDRALVPMENSLEGGVGATLDALAFDAEDVRIAGEVVHAVRHCLVAREAVAPAAVRSVASHPQATAQCARYLRAELGGARVIATASTAEAVRLVAGSAELPHGPWAALGTRLAAELYGCEVIAEDVEDADGNATRFVWLAPAGAREPAPAAAAGPMKTSLVFWGAGTGAPGWLVRCLSEFAFRGVNLTRIESRPSKRRLGEYVFFVDLDGHAAHGPVAGAVEGLRAQADVVRVLGSYPAAS